MGITDFIELDAISTRAAALDAKARSDPEAINSYLSLIGTAAEIKNTQAKCRIHRIALDPHGRPRIHQLANLLADSIVDYCIPRSRGEEALAAQIRTGSKRKEAQLQREAKNLFTTLEKSGEGGELLLYLLMEGLLGIPQVLCKMDLKTNANMHIHGVDGVHAKLSDNGNLAVYWGESKMYDTFSTALAACFSSIAPFLLDEGGGPLERDLILARDGVDLGDRDLTLAIARYFDSDTPEASRMEMRGACLIGFSHSDYGSPFKPDGVSLTDATLQEISTWMDMIENRLTKQNIHSFEIEIFCVPVPSADAFRDELRKAVLGS